MEWASAAVPVENGVLWGEGRVVRDTSPWPRGGVRAATSTDWPTTRKRNRVVPLRQSVDGLVTYRHWPSRDR